VHAPAAPGLMFYSVVMDLKSGYPFMLAKYGIPYDYPKLERDIDTDIVIIGAGISGALSAYYLTCAGFGCVVVDSRTVGTGSTCASTSLLQYELDKPLSKLSEMVGLAKARGVYKLCHRAIDELDKVCRDIGFSHFFRKRSVHYAAYKTHVAELHTEYLALQQNGFKVSYLNGPEVQNQLGFNAPAAIVSQQGAEINSYLFTHALLQYSIHRGLQVYDRSRITNIRYHKDYVKLTTTNGHTLKARKIINATGYESEKLVPDIATLHSTYAICSEQFSHKPDWKQDVLLWNTADPYLYIRSTHDNRIIVGGRDVPFYHPGMRDKLLRQKCKQLTHDFKKLFPDIPFIPEFSWAGTFGLTRTSLPFIGSLKQFPHTYFALGFGGNGITFSLIAAELICDVLQGKPNPDKLLFNF
jgi:glycine/D-amino acid oxidase-like deaminating enzyme